ncbi:hypothetical protein QE152_g39820 [Popillia japonica]|uniref:Uncharacterized protein n=1 Tax=Popillia japonica TaxID=7064 RepID=A0AAW1HT98_POPJA
MNLILRIRVFGQQEIRVSGFLPERSTPKNLMSGADGDHIISPFFIEENLNGQRYLDLLNTLTIPTLAVLQPDLRHQVWFQYDGCPAHSIREDRRLLTCWMYWPGRHNWWAGTFP